MPHAVSGARDVPVGLTTDCRVVRGPGAQDSAGVARRRVTGVATPPKPATRGPTSVTSTIASAQETQLEPYLMTVDG